jgi:hypothetical protein
LGNYTEAKTKLLEGRDLNVDQKSVEQALYHLKLFGFDEFYKDWRTVESEHFIFHLQPSLQIPDEKRFITEREGKSWAKVSRHEHGASKPSLCDLAAYEIIFDLPLRTIFSPAFYFVRQGITERAASMLKQEQSHLNRKEVIDSLHRIMERCDKE